MRSKAIRRLFSAALAVLALAPIAMAENPSDDVSGYNPFDGSTTTPPPQAQTKTSGSNVAEMFSTNGSGSTNPFDASNASAGDIFSSQAATGTFNTSTGAAINDPFNLGTSGTASADPFNTGATGAAATDPFNTGSAGATASDTSGAGVSDAAASDPFNAGTTGTASADPFNAGATGATSSDPFGTGSSSAAAADPFGTSSSSTATADPFGTGTAGTAGAAASDPFGAGAASAAATAAPMPTVSGYNPFTDAQNEAVQAVPANTVMYVSNGTVRLRAKPAENARVIANVYFGQDLAVTATQGDWAQVQNPNNPNNPNAVGYCLLNDLSSVNPNTLSKLMYAQLVNTPVYRTPSLKAGRVRTLKRGDTITQLAITADGLWSRVTDGERYGFVPTIYLDDTPAAEGTPVWCLSGSTAVMVNPDNWTQISTLSFGQQAYLVGYVYNNAIAKIRSGKYYVAYCDASALTTVDPAGLNTPVYTQAKGKVLASAASEDAKFTNINKNNYLTLLGVDNSQYWALVRQGKRKLYIPFIFLGSERIGTGNKVVVTNQDAPLYSAANASAGALATLPLGTRLYLGGGEGIYAQVATIPDGVTQAATGYVPIQYLRNE